VTLEAHAAATRDMVPHLATLTRLAGECLRIVEFGVRSGVSTWALLDGLRADGRLVSVDIGAPAVPERVRLDPRWSFIQGDDRTVQLPVSDAGLVFIDTSHEYHHTLAELEVAARLDPAWIILHDYALSDVADAVHGWLRRNRKYRIGFLEASEWMLVGLRRW
jgi:predicted O-methyltransferase YrrM